MLIPNKKKNSWFSSDFIKINKQEIIYPFEIFFSQLLEQLKTYLFTTFQFEGVFILW